MNKQIKQLAEQAGYNPAWSTKADREEYLDIEKFAELIIQDVLKEVRDEVQYITDFDTADRVVTSVKKHFGVAE